MYYQLYQIEKAKNEKAMKFINSLIEQLVSANPDLSKSIPPKHTHHSKHTHIFKQQHRTMLEQANHSLHRQVD